MKIVVVGCGKIGRNLINNLLAEGHDIAVIENDQAVLNEAVDAFDIMGICGMGTDFEALNEADVSHADLVIAVTGSDELNMLVCYFAKTLGAKNTVARIREREYNDKSLGFLQQQLQLSLSVNPEMSTARKINNLLKFPSAVHVESFASHRFEIVELILKNDSPIIGKSLIDLNRQVPAKFLICAVLRDNEVIIPDGRFVLADGDRIALTAVPSELSKLLRNLDLIRRKPKNVMIVGAGRTAYYLANMLLSAGNSVTVIDRDKKLCVDLSEALPAATVIHGDGTDQDLLLEEGLANMDAFISLTGYDENNILTSYFASSRQVPKVITKVNRSEFTPMALQLGIDTLISPIQTVSDEIVRYARALRNSLGSNVEKLYKIMGGHVEALEFKVSSEFKYCDTPLKNIKFKPNILIAGIFRNRKAMVPNGDDVILPGDKVIVVAAGHRLYDLTDIVSKTE